MNDITGIVVTYNTADIIKNAINSILKLIPDFKIIIIDNSDINNKCYNAVDNLKTKNITIRHTGINLGHGEGMKLGISLSTTRYLLLFDSDIIMKENCLPEMLSKIDNNCYGIGKVVITDNKGINSDVGIKYLHPFFCLINRENYNKYHPIIHHGAPMIKAMIDIDGRRKHKIIDYYLENKIIHLERGTRNILNGKQAKYLRDENIKTTQTS